ncbi:hypothetical protein B296_00029024 [Ensete ventricosum]|uniref:Fungal lipase-type domain-containing protein n=1 Tax=Ensete ventricosum TaxID=4639 RepID=A0A427A0P7_ENSVE|nr:hypothetical protein B296_00029024 [Ensete ventricosum]
MARRPWLKLLVLIGLFAFSEGREIKLADEDGASLYNRTLAKMLVEYASAVYITDLTALFTWTCSRCNDLTKVNHGVQNVQLMTFGQPRIGNAAFATYFNEHVADAVRVTHENDIVPHLPPYYSYFSQKTYHHFPREVYSV